MRTRIALPFPMGLIHPDWQHWHMDRAGNLYSTSDRDDTRPISPADLRWVWMYRDGIAAIEKERRRLTGPAQYLLDLAL